ncbi:hypothetical protein Tco_1305826, partial [Tanacetum coccineum]
VLGGDTCDGYILFSLLLGCSWRGHLRWVHILYITAWVFLAGTPTMGVLGGDICDGYIFFSLLPGCSWRGHLRWKMPPRRGTRTRTAPATSIPTTSMTDAAIRALIAQGVADALAEQEIQRNTNLNGDGS